MEFRAKGIRRRLPLSDRLGGAAFGAVSAATCGALTGACDALPGRDFKTGAGGGITDGTRGVSVRAEATSAVFPGLLGAGIKTFGGAVGDLRSGRSVASGLGTAASGAVGVGADGGADLEGLGLTAADGAGVFAMSGFGRGRRATTLGGVTAGAASFGTGGAFGRVVFGIAEICGAAGAGSEILGGVIFRATIFGGSIFGALSTGGGGIFRVVMRGFETLGAVATRGALGRVGR